MKSIVNADEFQNALKKAYMACAKRDSVPALRNILVTFQGDTCTLTGTNMEQWCQVTIPAEGDFFSFVFDDTKRILTACKYYSGELTLDYMQDKPPEYAPNKANLPGTVTLFCGSRACSQRVSPAADHPTPPEIKEPVSYHIDPDAIFQRYKRIKYALSCDPARPTSMYVQFVDERMFTVDGYRLALSRDPALQVQKKFFAPPGAMELLPILEGADCSLLVGQLLLIFECGNTRIISRTTWGDGLNVDATIPTINRERCTVNVDDFLREMQYINEFAAVSNRQPVRFENGNMRLEGPVSRCRARIELSNPMDTVVGFSPSYMLDALKQFKAKKVETVTMHMTSQYSPILLTDNNGDLAMVLPVRLKEAAKAA